MSRYILCVLAFVSLIIIGGNAINNSSHRDNRINVTEKTNNDYDDPLVFDIRYNDTDSVYEAEFSDGVVYSADTDCLIEFVQLSTCLDSAHHWNLLLSLKAYYDHPIPECVR